MATVNKDFKIKSGLIVEGTNATVNGNQILTENASDTYILNLIGGETLVKSVSNEFDVSVAGELSIDRATVDAYYDAAGDAADAEAAAIAAAALDATSKANAAQAAAEATASADATSKANAAQAAAEATASADATSKANAAQAAAEATASADATSKANAAEAAANSYTDSSITNLNLSGTYDALGAAADALADANAYTDLEIAALVDSAPAMLDTLNELAAAIADNPNYATDVANLVATKADTTYVDGEISAVDTAAQGYASTAQSNAESFATTAANNAQTAAETFASGLSVNYDAAGSAASAQTAAESYASGLDSATNTRIDNLDTDDVAEGTRLYFTDARAKTSAADLLTGANLTNITITGTGAGLTITAENGVADSTTNDLAEGNNHLYFTEQRALDAVAGSNIQPESIDITWVRRENATWTNVPTASQVVCHQAGAGEGSMKYLVRVTANVGGTQHSHVTELLATVDGSHNVAVVEYGTIYTSTNPMASATVLWNGLTNCYELNVTTANNNSEVMVAATMLAYQD